LLFLVKKNVIIVEKIKEGKIMEDIVFTPEEVRDLVRTLPERAKVEIVKGLAMFEAGYKTGFFDGARNAADGAQQSA